MNVAYNAEDNVLNKQAFEALTIQLEAAPQLLAAVRAAATSAELLERSQLFVNG